MTKSRAATNFLLTIRSSLPNHGDEMAEDGNNEKDQEGTAVECRELEFAYPERPRRKILSNVNVEVSRHLISRDCKVHGRQNKASDRAKLVQIPSGGFVAFVGPSGCGKTTMISLQERFYDPTTGSIRVDGAEASSVPLRRYRQSMALVQQEPVLFQGSIRDNIALGDGGDGTPTDAEILAACEQANIGEFVASLPEGLATPCGSQGLQLSGGQRQRIAIARALVRKPRLLLLDEATSALDSESEKVVKQALDAAARAGGRTTVAVAHRLSTVRDADAIYVFVRGRVVESGSHDSLLEKRGVYYDMCMGQSLDRSTTS